MLLIRCLPSQPPGRSAAPVTVTSFAALNLAFTVAFAADPGFRFLYYLAVLVNAQVIVSGTGSFALSRFSWVPSFLR